MDQVTTFMEEQLVSSKRYADDKILTKTMINNYAKNKLLPPPEKKRYSKEHVLMLIFIYYFKNILSINDIQTLLTPIDGKNILEDQANLKRFSFICLLSFDVYVKKMMIEHIIDGMNPESEHNSKKKK